MIQIKSTCLFSCNVTKILTTKLVSSIADVGDIATIMDTHIHPVNWRKKDDFKIINITLDLPMNLHSIVMTQDAQRNPCIRHMYDRDVLILKSKMKVGKIKIFEQFHDELNNNCTYCFCHLSCLGGSEYLKKTIEFTVGQNPNNVFLLSDNNCVIAFP